MIDTPDGQDRDKATGASAHRTHRSRIPLVWVIPAIAVCIGLWLAVRTALSHGPSITLTFIDAAGIEANKTKLRYENVEIGTVKAITLLSDRHSVEVRIDTDAVATPFLVDSSRFWVVRPHLATGEISGLETILSGPYIAMDAGGSRKAARHFVGMEEPPVVAGGQAGRAFTLHAVDVGSLTIASPLYFHRLNVGRVTHVALDSDGKGVTLQIFVNAPYDRFVTSDTRFWHASGIDVEVDSGGVHVQSQSLSTIVAGGIAFNEIPDGSEKPPAAEGQSFPLLANRLAAMRPPDGTPEQFVLTFDQSLRGLSPGALVDFRGVDIGNVVALKVAFDGKTGTFSFPVLINLYPARLGSQYANASDSASAPSLRVLVAGMVKKGFRAQLRTSSLLTGQLYVALDFFPRVPTVRASPQESPMPLPTIPGTLDQVQTAVVSLAQKLDQLPLDAIGRNLNQSLSSLNETLRGAHELVSSIQADILPDLKSTAAHASSTLLETQRALAPGAGLQDDLHNTLSSVGKAADSIRILADYLDAHPEALIRGKMGDAK